MTSLHYSLLATVFLFAAAPAMAATDGTLGDTSEGSSDIDLTLPPTVKLTGVGDITLAPNADALAANVTMFDDVCVYSNVTAARNFTVTASGDGAANAFTVTDGTTPIAYTVTFKAGTGGTGTALTAGTVSGNFANGANNYDCTGGATSSFDVTFSPDAMQAGFAGDYTGTLTLLVSPGV
ncbi:MAG: hypothetical protein WAS21_08160 [Geminicoccaceae bacterium]